MTINKNTSNSQFVSKFHNLFRLEYFVSFFPDIFTFCFSFSSFLLSFLSLFEINEISLFGREQIKTLNSNGNCIRNCETFVLEGKIIVFQSHQFFFWQKISWWFFSSLSFSLRFVSFRFILCILIYFFLLFHNFFYMFSSIFCKWPITCVPWIVNCIEWFQFHFDCLFLFFLFQTHFWMLCVCDTIFVFAFFSFISVLVKLWLSVRFACMCVLVRLTARRLSCVACFLHSKEHFQCFRVKNWILKFCSMVENAKSVTTYKFKTIQNENENRKNCSKEMRKREGVAGAVEKERIKKHPRCGEKMRLKKEAKRKGNENKNNNHSILDNALLRMHTKKI